ncbi:hypothetical protein [Lysobacter gummosus]|uniref:hypothetical protein n=1 Tax=Lysobacter gummosus TaxID=262324 RepID=UPI00363B5D5F
MRWSGCWRFGPCRDTVERVETKNAPRRQCNHRRRGPPCPFIGASAGQPAAATISSRRRPAWPAPA